MLSTRELDVVRLIALGHTSSEIANQLVLSVRTNQSHRARIQDKLGITSRAGLVAYALRHGLITPESTYPARRATVESPRASPARRL